MCLEVYVKCKILHLNISILYGGDGLNVNYEYYKVFYFVARYGSVTAAANALFNNQPNITRTIKKLESELGCTLFIRRKNGVTLTAEGEKLYARVSAAVENIKTGEDEIALDKSLQSGRISVAVSEIALHCTLLPALKIFRNKYPGVRLKISNLTTPKAIEVLKNGLADFALVTEPFTQTGDICSKTLQSINEVAVCSSAFSLSTGTVLTARQLTEYPIIGLCERTGSNKFYTDYFNTQNLHFEPEIEANAADQILPMVKSDLGIGFVPKEFLKNEDLSNLIILNLTPPIPQRCVCLLKRKNTHLGVAAERLEKIILEPQKNPDF